MSKLTITEYVTLDGVMEEPSWTSPYFDDEVGAFKQAELFDNDALLLGRKTYEGFAAAWPTMTDEDGFADRMNSLPKYVASTTLQSAGWNASILEGDTISAVAKLKKQSDQDLLVYGSSDLVNTLLQHKLVDQLDLLVFPVTLGKGKRLFHDGFGATLTLANVRRFGSGVALLRYVQAE